MSNSARPNAVPQGHHGPAKPVQQKDVSAKIPGPWIYTPKQVLGFFPKAFKPRDQQIAAIEQIANAFSVGKKYAVLEMPTGGGKSFICYSFADCLREHGGTHFLTIQKQLQKQYAADFPAPQIEVLMGRANYACTHPGANEGADAAHGVCTSRKKGILIDCVDVDASGWADFDEDGNPRGILRAAGQLELPACAHKCPYWNQLQKCNDSGVTLFNFSSFLFQTRIGRFGKRALMIIDEGHNVESELMKFVTLELNEWALSLVNVKITRTIASKDQFVEWLRETDLLRLVQEATKSAQDSEENDPDGFGKEEAEALRELEMKIENFMAYLEKTQWVLETAAYQDKRGDDRRKIVARPLYAKDFAEDLLFRHADRILFMSATILDAKVWATNLGIKMEDLEHVQSPCDFPVENRPIFLEYAGNLSYKYFTPEQNPSNPTKPKFINKIKQIMARHHGQRGIIHCHSFELSKVLKYDVADPRFLFQDDFKGGKDEMLKVHGQSTDSVIVAPALHEGLDLKDDLARFAVIAKVPWPSMMDKVIKERMALDQKWYAWLTSLKICQSLGRGVRSKTDWCFNYVVDQGFDGFLARNGSMIPRYIKDAFQKYAPKEVRRA
jgi:ATP-dependent DNA helicase DinG